MSGWTHQTVTRELIVWLAEPHDDVISVRAVLHYDVTDPYAITARFWPDSSGPVTWVFARELLSVGLDGAAGEGDVRIFSSWPGARDSVFIALTSHEGEALIQLPISQVADFLSTTYILCAPGEEDGHLDTDRAIAQLLAS
ncbi:MAG: SsgA family sporulation/cell division regulator [Actinomycetes bacterium]